MQALRSDIALPDPFSPELIDKPWEFDDFLRQNASVYYDERNSTFFVSGYDLVREVLLDPDRFSSRYMERFISREPMPEAVLAVLTKGYPIVDALLVTDGDVHARHRRFITTSFSMKRLDELSPLFTTKINTALARVLPNRRMFVIRDYANLIPIVMMMEQLRIRYEETSRALNWSAIISGNLGGIEKSLDQRVADAEELVTFQRYFEDRITTEIRALDAGASEQRGDDLLTMLASAVRDPANPMNMVEALSLVFNLFPATHDTTSASLAACIHRLTSSREAQQAIHDDPNYIGRLIDETMRHESPARGFWRRALNETELAGVLIPAGSWLFVRVSSANRDAKVYEAADEFKPDRSMKNPHMSFGTGIHTCAGRAFARRIMTLALKGLTEAASNFRFADGGKEHPHVPNPFVTSLVDFEIEFDPR